MGRPSVLWLPGAERDEHGRDLEYTEWTDPKGCLHTTETSGWPDYSGWTIPPQMTVMPIPNVGVKVRQHIPLDQAGFALRNLAGGVETNTDCILQIELVGSCRKGGPGYYWPGADDAVLRGLGGYVLRPVSQILGIPMKALRFQAYDASYGPRGVTNTVRLSGAAFDTYTGWLGHQHVPENVHGDPGAFPWDRMMQLLEEDGDMDWNQKVTIDAQQAAALNLTRGTDNQLKAGDAVEVGWLIAWGGARGAQVYDTVKNIRTRVDQLPTTTPPLSDTDRLAIARQVAALLPKPPTAGEVAAELIRQLRN